MSVKSFSLLVSKELFFALFWQKIISLTYLSRLSGLGVPICLLALTIAFSDVVRAESIAPALEQEFSDAKAAIEDAHNLRAEQFAPEPMQQAQELMKAAINARQSKDSGLFSRASRLARTYAELAKSIVELQTDSTKLAAAKESLDKIKSEIEQLKKAP